MRTPGRPTADGKPPQLDHDLNPRIPALRPVQRCPPGRRGGNRRTGALPRVREAVQPLPAGEQSHTPARLGSWLPRRTRGYHADMRKTQLLIGIAIGAGGQYLLDQSRGRSRRARLRDQAAARVRRLRRDAARRDSYLRGRRMGEVARARGAGTFHPTSDQQVTEHLHETLARSGFSTADVTVEVSDGLATLRGQVADDGQRRSLVDAVRSQPGVDSVRSWLHLPGEPAPNKAAAYQASAAATPS